MKEKRGKESTPYFFPSSKTKKNLKQNKKKFNKILFHTKFDDDDLGFRTTEISPLLVLRPLGRFPVLISIESSLNSLIVTNICFFFLLKISVKK